jgi:hypothetical protein
MTSANHFLATFIQECICRPALADTSSTLELGDGAYMVMMPPVTDTLRRFAVWMRSRHSAEAEAVLASVWADITSRWHHDRLAAPSLLASRPLIHRHPIGAGVGHCKPCVRLQDHG